MVSVRRKYLVIFLLSIVIVNIFAVNAIAADMDTLQSTLDEQQENNTRSYNLWAEFFKLIVALGLIIGTAWSAIRIFGNRANSRMQGTWLRIVDEVVLGQNRGVVLCEVGEKLYALGVTDHNVSFLFEVNNPKLIEDISVANSVNESGDKTSKDIKTKLSDILRLERKTPPVKDNFQILIGEQLQKLDKISNKRTGNFSAGRGRSDKNDQA